MNRTRLPNRRSIRMPEYDYSRNGAYFVTVSTTQRLALVGAFEDGEFRFSDIGQVVDAAWQDSPNHTDGLILDEWVVMPNHLHGIVVLPGTQQTKSPDENAFRRLQPGSLGTVFGGFKSAVSREVSARKLTLVRPLWQRNYFERVIRNDRELDATRRYIETNPVRWHDDPNHPRFHPHHP
jgi:putative transposase